MELKGQLDGAVITDYNFERVFLETRFFWCPDTFLL